MSPMFPAWQADSLPLSHQGIPVFHSDYTNATNNVQGFPVLHILSNIHCLWIFCLFFYLFIFVCGFFDDSHFDWCEVILVLIYISIMTNDVQHILMYLLGMCISSLKKCLFKSFLSIFNWVVYFCCS